MVHFGRDDGTPARISVPLITLAHARKEPIDYCEGKMVERGEEGRGGGHLGELVEG